VITPTRLDVLEPAEALRRLELIVTRRLDGLLQGDVRGLVPGHGSEPGEAREYSPGDDVRRMDWNVTARMMHPHVRETIADRELESWVLADLSASLSFGTADCEKRDLAIAAVAAVGFLTNRHGNRMGSCILTSDGRRQVVPARGGRTHLLQILHRLLVAPTGDGGGAVDLATGILELDRLAARRGLAVVVSDFLAPPGWERSLRRLSTRHDVLCVEVLDRRELELPPVGVLEVIDPESGRVREVQTSDPRLRARYAEAAAAQRHAIARSIRAAGADHLVLRTDRDWLGDVVRFVVMRRRRVETLRRVQP
jgi:uncharacterized protein (DUF58 family)